MGSVAEPPDSGIRGRVWSWFSTHSDTRAVRLLRRCVHTAARYVHAENHDISTNGEVFLLDCLRSDARTILDVGACNGDWALEAATRCPAATVYCFEIASPTRRKLEGRVRGQPRVRVMPTGLADRSMTVRVKHYPSRPAWTSLYDYPHERPSVWLEEVVSTGDVVMEEAGLPGIDLLKLDAEGSEMAVLRGLEGALARHLVRVIQFEYGYAAAFSHALLLDFYALLEPLGYVIGRLHRDVVEFAPYRLEDENFFGPNFVAVRREEEAIIRCLRPAGRLRRGLRR